MNQILERERLSSEAYKLYNFLCNNCVGEKNAIKQDDLVTLLEIDRRTIRKCISELLVTTENMKIVCTGNSGVWIASSKEEGRRSAETDLKKAIAHLEKYWAVMRKIGLDGQYKITFSKYEKPIVESIAHEEKTNDLYFEDEFGNLQLPI